MSRWTVRNELSGPGGSRMDAVLASLPSLFAVVPLGPAEVRVVSGAEPERVRRACHEEARAIVIERPGMLEPSDLDDCVEVAARSGGTLVPALVFVPRVAAVLARGELAESVAQIECTLTSAQWGPHESLVELLATIRFALGPIESARLHHRVGSEMVVEAAAHGSSTLVLLNRIDSVRAGALELRAIGRHTLLIAGVSDGPLARTATVRRSDAHGVRSPWPDHEHAHRRTMRWVGEHLVGEATPAVYDATELRADARLARRVLGP